MDDCIITERNRQIWLVAAVAVSIFMFTLDYCMLNISLPSIARSFGVGIGIVERLPLVYLLVVTSTLLGFGKLGDIKGFKKIFILGLAIFVTGTFLCGIAQSVNMLLAFRAFQCLGEAMMSPMGIAMITACLPSNIKGMALGIAATAQGLGFCFGPVVGGLINSTIGWHYIFFVNIPIGICAIALSYMALPKKQPESSDSRFDVVGAILAFISLSALVYALNSGFRMGWTSKVILSCFGASLLFFILFIIREKKVPYPLLDLGLFRNKNFSCASIATFFAIFIYMGIIFLFPFYLELVMRLTVVKAGFVLMLPALMMMLLSPVSGRLSDRIGSRRLCSLAMAIATLAFVMFACVKARTSGIFVILSFLLSGVAMGLFMAPNNKLVMINAPRDKQGMASGVYKIVISAAGVFGIAILPLFFIYTVLRLTGLARLNLVEVEKSPELMVAGFHSVFTAGILICLTALVFSILAKDKNTESD